MNRNTPKPAKARFWGLVEGGTMERVHSCCILLLDRAEIQTWTLLIFCAELVEIMTFFFFLRSIYPPRFLIFLRALPACARRSLERKQKVCEQEIRKRKRPILSCWKYCKTQNNILNNPAAASSTAVQFFRFSFVCRIFFLNPPPLILDVKG